MWQGHDLKMSSRVVARDRAKCYFQGSTKTSNQILQIISTEDIFFMGVFFVYVKEVKAVSFSEVQFSLFGWSPQGGDVLSPHTATNSLCLGFWFSAEGYVCTFGCPVCMLERSSPRTDRDVMRSSPGVVSSQPLCLCPIR